MSGFTLSLRAGEHKQYFEKYLGQFGPNVFAVMLSTVPEFPGEAHPEGRNLQVLCASRYKTSAGITPDTLLWGWVHLDPDTKEKIGLDLEAGAAKENVWYFLELSYSPGQD